MQNNNKPQNPNIDNANNTKPMDSRKEVEQSNDMNIGEDFPGYPHYPASEDIMAQETGNYRVDVDVENIPNNKNVTGVSQRFDGGSRDRAKDAMTPQPGLGNDDKDSEYDVTEDELAALNSTDAEIGTPQNVSNDDLNTDLDIPGSELDDENEAIGEEDEENNYYSLGGDNHENLEEDRGV